MNKAIMDTGPPLHLNQIGSIRLLKIFKTLVVSIQVKKELQEFDTWPFLEKETMSLQEETVNDNEIAEARDRCPNLKGQRADLSVYVLVRRIMNSLALTDDLALRRAIESLDRVVVGSVGVLIRGYKEKWLSKDELSKCVDLLFNDSSLYLSRAFGDRVLKLIKELERT